MISLRSSFWTVRGAFGLRVGGNPVENLAVAFALLQLGEQFLRIDAGEVKDVLIERAVEVILAAFAGDFGSAFVQHAGQQDIAAETGARAHTLRASAIRRPR